MEIVDCQNRFLRALNYNELNFYDFSTLSRISTVLSVAYCMMYNCKFVNFVCVILQHVPHCSKSKTTFVLKKLTMKAPTEESRFSLLHIQYTRSPPMAVLKLKGTQNPKAKREEMILFSTDYRAMFVWSDQYFTDLMYTENFLIYNKRISLNESPRNLE